MKTVTITKTGKPDHTIYDVSVNGAWAFSRSSADNVFTELQKITNSEPIKLEFREE